MTVVPPTVGATRLAPTPSSRRVVPTASAATRALGVTALVGTAVGIVLALVVSPPDAVQGDAVRFLYLHVPGIWVAYLAFIGSAATSALYLLPRTRRRSLDRWAGALAEVGVVLTGVNIFTGMLWGKLTWGVYWQWQDARLVTTLMMFLTYIGYLAVRRIPADPAVRSKRSAVMALVAVLNIVLVRWSVEWWNTLHQEASISVRDEAEITGEMLATLMFCFVVVLLVGAWLVVHRARLIRLEEIAEEEGLERAIAARRAEAAAAVGAAGMAPADTPS
jgi:heme exporter protein C